MKIARMIMTVALMFASTSYALETDNYITWQIELKDSSDKINSYINQQFQEAIEEANREKKPLSCKKITAKIGKRFKTSPPKKHPLEDWLKANLDEEYVFPKEHNYRERSIYQVLFRFYLKYVELAPNVQVNGIYLGTDKLSHFVSTGRRYWEHYTKRLKRGMKPDEALKSAIRFGLRNEITYLGTWSSGVFSYGDMEANYQGLQFYLKICSSEQPYLRKNVSNEWEQVEDFNIRNYVNPYWDESFNPSYRLPKNWLKTGPVIKKNYCELRYSEIVQSRFHYYESMNHTSPSLEYIRELLESGHRLTPDPKQSQNVEALCEE